jgi:hypothetical protein
LGSQFDRGVQAVVELLGLQQERRGRHGTVGREGKGGGKGCSLRAATVPVDEFGDLQAEYLAAEVEADTPTVGVDFADGSHD